MWVSQPQNLFQFCSKMSVGLTICPAVSPIQPIFNPAIPTLFINCHLMTCLFAIFLTVWGFYT